MRINIWWAKSLVIQIIRIIRIIQITQIPVDKNVPKSCAIQIARPMRETLHRWRVERYKGVYLYSRHGYHSFSIPVPRDLLALELADDDLREESELAEGALAQPTPEGGAEKRSARNT